MKLREIIEDKDFSATAKEESTCAICGKPIKIGDKIGSFNDKPVHKECLLNKFRSFKKLTPYEIVDKEGSDL
jgi:hypothetical protein